MNFNHAFLLNNLLKQQNCFFSIFPAAISINDNTKSIIEQAFVLK